MGMGLELSLVLGLMGTVWTGNPLSLDPGFSIGATKATGAATDNILGNLLGLLGKLSLRNASHTGRALTYDKASLVVLKAPTTGSNPILH